MGATTTYTTPSSALYVTYEDLGNEIVSLSEHVPTDKDAETWCEVKIQDAQNEIDGRLAGIYSTPFSAPVPTLIKAIALYFSASRILNPGYVGEIPAESKMVDTYYKRGDDLLKRIESGEIFLPDATASTEAASIQSTTSDLSRTFTQTTYDEDGNVLATGTLDGV